MPMLLLPLSQSFFSLCVEGGGLPYISYRGGGGGFQRRQKVGCSLFIKGEFFYLFTDSTVSEDAGIDRTVATLAFTPDTNHSLFMIFLYRVRVVRELSLYLFPESIDWFIAYQGFLAIVRFDSTPTPIPPPPSPSASSLSWGVGGGRGAKSDNCEKSWPSTDHFPI